MMKRCAQYFILVIIIIFFVNLNVFSENKLKIKDPLKHQIISTNADSTIATLLSEINPDTIEYFMQSLQDFGTRYALVPNRFEVADWIRNKFISFGFSDVLIDSFEQHTTFPIDTITWQANVIATHQGTERPDDIYIIGAHYDSWVNIGDPWVFAPGADDNASGISSLLEISRVIKTLNFVPEATIIFIAFASEESGVESGADNYAQKAYDAGLDIKIMINNDAISYTTQSTENRSVHIWGRTEFDKYKLYSSSNTVKYTNLIPIIMPNEYGSDGTSFTKFGFPAFSISEAEHNPRMHSDEDILSNCTIEYCNEIIKASCANLLSYIGKPSKISNQNIIDMGNGQSLMLNWSPPTDADLQGYFISVGTESRVYDTTFVSTDTTFIIDNLGEGVEYFIGITAFDMDGYESFLIEGTGTPYSLPLSPVELIDSPQWHQVELKWSPNSEYDLLGYNIYRSTNEEELGGKLNTEIISDTVFIDESTENGVYYYYTVKAVDNQLNESTNNIPVKSRSVSLDQGIVIVDETADGNGSLLNPTDEEVDEFYSSLLKRFEKQNFDIIDEGDISLKDLGAFSTVIWDGSDYRDMTTASEIVDDIQRYLDYGGNLIYTGYKPSLAFEGNALYPTEFETGDFIFDYLKINQVKSTFGSRFVGAIPLMEGYEEIYTDSLKTSPNSNYHLSYIEGIYANLGGTEIYLYDTDYDTSTNQGKMKNEPVGVEYIGDDYKAVTLSFPLYYMQFDQAKVLIEYILTEKFSEVVSLKDEKQFITPKEFVLEQNYPNPFNPSTKIKFALSEAEVVKIEIYNTLGQGLETLLNEHMKTGQYEVEFNGSHLSSGIYFYRIEAGDFQDVKKMVLIK